MSTPALRRPAGIRPVAREFLERLRGPHYSGALALGVLGVVLRIQSISISYEALTIFLGIAGLLFVPAQQGIEVPTQNDWDAAMPMDRARFALARLASGTAWAVFLLAVAIGLHAVLFGGFRMLSAGESVVDYPGWYPLAVFAFGLTFYLLGSAALLHPLSTVVALSIATTVGIRLFRWREEIEHLDTPEVLAWTALPLAVACATACAAACFPARPPEPPRPAKGNAPPPQREPARALPDYAPPAPAAPAYVLPGNALPDRAVSRPVRRSTSHRPPAALTVVRAHFTLLRRRTWLPVAILAFYLLCLLLVGLSAEPGTDRTVRSFVESMALGWWCVVIALSWTVLVWLEERGAQRRWNDALPVGPAKRRVLHAAAGAAWLLLFLLVLVVATLAGAVVAGTLASPVDIPMWLWLGLPLRTLTLYLAATFAFFGLLVVYHLFFEVLEYATSKLPDIHVRIPGPLARAVFLIQVWIGGVAVPYASFMIGVELLKSQAGLLTGNTSPNGWSHPAAALWLVLYATAAAGAIGLSDWFDHHDRLPTASEARGFLR
ncbi:MAG TPA: hypothetical protein VHG28_07630 [Longimicrobiaceae bacterium]|nr:hypothetical protein [Longimicrobiaceae bacterium]